MLVAVVTAAVTTILLATHAEAQKEALAHEQRVGAAEQKGVYGTDDRTDEGHAAECVGEACEGTISEPLRSVGSEATVALIPRAALSYHARTNSWIPRRSWTLGEAYNMCPIDPVTNSTTRFIDQPTPASCSGTVVQWDPLTKTGLVASAAHCFDADGATNGCQNSQGGLIGVPERDAECMVRASGSRRRHQRISPCPPFSSLRPFILPFLWRGWHVVRDLDRTGRVPLSLSLSLSLCRSLFVPPSSPPRFPCLSLLF